MLKWESRSSRFCRQFADEQVKFEVHFIHPSRGDE